jgi:photosystem II stability/assembly factor-like uncharacterized protein
MLKTIQLFVVLLFLVSFAQAQFTERHREYGLTFSDIEFTGARTNLIIGATTPGIAYPVQIRNTPMDPPWMIGPGFENLTGLSQGNAVASHPAAPGTLIAFQDGTAKFLRSTNGGQSWSAGTQAEIMNITDLEFSRASSSVAFAVGYGGTSQLPIGYLYRSTNAGASWDAVSVPQGSRTYRVSVFDHQHVWLTDQSLNDTSIILRTTDGGANWSTTRLPTPGHITDVHVLDPDSGIVLTSSGRILRTTDGGVSWQPATLNSTSTNLTAVSFSSVGLGVAIGSRIYRTMDFGRTWYQMSLAPNNFAPRALAFAGPTEAWMLSNGTETVSGTTTPVGVVYEYLYPRPNLVRPLNGDTAGAASVTFNWTPGSLLSTRFEIQVARDSLFQNVVFADTNRPGNSGTVSFGPFTAGETYYWRVRAKEGVILSPYSTTFSFQAIGSGGGETGDGGGTSGPPVAGTSWTLIAGPDAGEIDGIVSTASAVVATTWRGLYRSTDAGASWQLLPKGPITYPGKLFVVNSHLYHGSTTSNALARSTDHGETWTSVNSGITASGINAMVASGDTIYLATSNGIFRSISGGSSWTGFSTGIPAGSANIVYTLAKYGQEIFAGTAFGLYQLSAGSSMWVQVTSVGTSSVKFLASNGTTFVRGDSSPKYSTDGGSSWQNSTGASGATVNDLRSNGISYLLGYEASGVFRSTDDGATWVKSDAGLVDKYVQQLTSKDGIWYAATSGVERGGVYRSTDGGASWSRSSRGLRALKLTKMSVDGSTILVGSDGFGVFRSTNGGGSWALTNQGSIGSFSRVVRDVETGGGIWFVGTASSGVYRSSDAGVTWEEKTYGINADVNDLAVSGSTVLAGTVGGGVRRSTDLGLTWGATPSDGIATGDAKAVTLSGSTLFAYLSGVYRWTPGETGWTGLAVSAGPTTAWGGIIVRADTIYVGAFGSKGVFSGSGGFYVSTDGGQSWMERGEGIQYETVKAMAISDNAVIVSNRYGTWRTNNKGVTWTDVREGLPLFGASDLRISGNVIYGVYGADLYARQLDRVTSVEQVDHSQPTDFELAHNYPNPFNPSTTIRFSLPLEGRVSLKIYDQLGREVATLVNGSLSAGQHQIRWDASGMASGLYIFRIEAVGADGVRFVRTNKMVLMK